MARIKRIEIGVFENHGWGDLGEVREDRAPSFPSEFCIIFKEFSVKKEIVSFLFVCVFCVYRSS